MFGRRSTRETNQENVKKDLARALSENSPFSLSKLPLRCRGIISIAPLCDFSRPFFKGGFTANATLVFLLSVPLSSHITRVNSRGDEFCSFWRFVMLPRKEISAAAACNYWALLYVFIAHSPTRSLLALSSVASAPRTTAVVYLCTCLPRFLLALILPIAYLQQFHYLAPAIIRLAMTNLLSQSVIDRKNTSEHQILSSDAAALRLAVLGRTKATRFSSRCQRTCVFLLVSGLSRNLLLTVMEPTRTHTHARTRPACLQTRRLLSADASPPSVACKSAGRLLVLKCIPLASSFLPLPSQRNRGLKAVEATSTSEQLVTVPAKAAISLTASESTPFRSWVSPEFWDRCAHVHRKKCIDEDGGWGGTHCISSLRSFDDSLKFYRC